MKLSFYGGAGSVTGANHLLEIGETRILIDCGLFQGDRELRKKNTRPWPYDPSSIDTLILTHAHADHNGRIPRLVGDGFHGPIIGTPPTIDLSELTWKDSLRLLQQDESEEGNDEPLYTEKDLARTMKQVQPLDYGDRHMLTPGVNMLTPGVSITLQNAGHILGSSMVIVEAEGKRIVFTGDVGNELNPLLTAPDLVGTADYLIIESAYGDRKHATHEESRSVISRVIRETAARNGVLMIPAFSLERTQELLYDLNELVEAGTVPRVPVFLDSPLAIRATEMYSTYTRYFNAAAQKDIKSGDAIFQFPGLRMTLTRDESKAINEVQPPKIVIAGSGNSIGGRILHHERRYLPDPNSTLLVIGFQVKGGLGRRLLDGEKEVRIFDESVTVRAHIEQVSGYSAHADSDGLFGIVERTQGPVQKVFVVQGEETAAEALATRVHDELGFEAVAPKDGESYEL